MNILIVDDIAANRKLLHVTFQAEGHTLFEAADGIQALEILNHEQVDAVLSDILMPRMDGYRLCHEIRADERLRHLPIVIYTSTYNSTSDEKLALSLGANKFLRKPAPLETILTALRDAIAMPHTASRPDGLGDVEVLKEYSDRLVAKLEEANIELEQRLKLSALSIDVGAALMHGNDLQEILQRCSEAMVRQLDAAFARIWTHNEREKMLELRASAGLYTHINGPHGRVPVGQFKIGLIAAEQKPHLTNSVIGDPRVPEQEWARREGLVAFAGYPLIIRDRVVGVMAMFARAHLSQATMDQLASIADAIALGIDRKQAEEELRHAHDQLHRLLALSPAIIYNLKIEGPKVVVTFVSDNMERISGRTAAETMSYNWWLESLHPEDHDRMVAALAQELKQGIGYTEQYRIRHRDGSYRWVIDSNHVVRDAAGAPQEVMGAWTDISEHKREEAVRKQLESIVAAAESANRAKSAFLSTMSHEIRTPMNAILGYAQLMLRDPALGEEAKANLEIIGRSGEHLLTLINDVLDMSKIEAGRTELNPATFSIVRLLHDISAMFRLRAEAKMLRFAMVVDGESVPYVVADEGKIRQALINLLGNAIKFTKRGEVKLHVTLDQRSDNRLWLLARVEDTGPGISGEDQKKLFEPFSQAKGLNIERGTGLGLAITRKYARLMGGDVTVSSSVDVGSVFRFEIPVKRGNAGVAVKQIVPRRVIRIRAGTTGDKILVVDDQFENRDWLIKLLTAIGFSVVGVDNGKAAIRSWEEWNPRLILMDLHMPIMDGLEATRRIKADPRGKGTVIIALTASAMEEDRQVALQSGADSFLSKPCREDELLEMLRTLLNIAYDYEEVAGTEDQPIAGAAAFSAESLGQLPLVLVGELRDATLNGDKALLNKLVRKVREIAGAETAQGLQALADRYEYDALTQLLEEACRR
jgi:PAS domain S-box-containing protein